MSRMVFACCGRNSDASSNSREVRDGVRKMCYRGLYTIGYDSLSLRLPATEYTKCSLRVRHFLLWYRYYTLAAVTMLPALDKNAKAVLITGATGKQGGATINSLIDSGALATYKLLAVTRDTNSSAARELAARGVTLIQGDLSDCHALFHTAMILLASENRSRSIWGVFSVQVCFWSGYSGISTWQCD